jgi:hypothetical protein
MESELKIEKVSVPEYPTIPKNLETHTLKKNERDLIGELSMSAFGAKCRWQKFVGKMKVVGRTRDEKGKVVNQYQETTIDDVVEYMKKTLLLKSLPADTLNMMDRLSFGCFSRHDAWRNIYLGDPRPIENSEAVFKEMAQGMLKVVATKIFVESDEGDQIKAVAEFFRSTDDVVKNIPFVLLVKDQEKVDEKLAMLEATLRDKAGPYLVTEFKNDESIPVDSIKVLDALLEKPVNE